MKYKMFDRSLPIVNIGKTSSLNVWKQ